MPWSVKRQDCKQADGTNGRYVVVKDTTGEVESCHTTRAEAEAAVRAREANVDEERGRIDGVAYGAVDAKLDRAGTGNSWLTVRIREGKNRELRKIFGHFGHPVSRLIRVAYGPFQLNELARGGVEEVGPALLRDQLGGLRSPTPKPNHAHRRR